MDELDSLDKLGLEPANDESSTTANSIDINRESRAQMYLSDPKDLHQ